MGLRMITGRTNVDKSAFIIDEIKEKLRAHPTGRPIFYIVPEQMTFQQEYELFQDDTIRGSTRAQVVSFSRLAWRVLQETGGGTKQFISSTGTQMMLRKIIEQRTDSFHIFQKAADKQGFIKELDGMMTEFKRHCITPDMLEEQIPYATDRVALQQKLEDLHYIYDEMMALFAHKYMDGEDQLQLLVEKIASTPLFAGAEVYVDGFHRFSPKEQAILLELLKATKQVSVALILDEANLSEEATELDLFYQTAETFQGLQQLAKGEQLPLSETVQVPDAYQRFTGKPVMQHLESHFDERPAPAYEQAKDCPIHLAEAVHPRAELEAVIQEMLRLTRDDNYRYRDMVIYMRDTAGYHDLIRTMFQDYGIPVFIDEKKTMLNHPLIEFIRSLLDVVDTNWRYDGLFRLLKTGWIRPTDASHPLTADAIDVLENYVLEYGVRGKKQWLEERPWKYKRFVGFSDAVQTDREKEKEAEINAFRNQVRTALQEFDDNIRQAKTVQAKCEQIYLLMEHLSIPTQLEKRRNQFNDTGEIEKAREEEQVWNGFIQLLDEAVEMIGAESMSQSMFQKTLEAGLEALEFSHVPPSMDHVIVGSIDHSRVAGKKCSFLLGVNEGSWPMKPPLDGMINEQEREFLKHFGMELAASNRRILLDDTFYMYLAFTSASEYLWVSYVISDSEGKMKTPAQIIDRLWELFPKMAPVRLLQEPDELQEAGRFITTPVKTRAALTVQFARLLRGYPMSPVWQDVLAWYMDNEAKSDTTYKVLQSLFYENIPRSLKEETVQALYPKQVKTSVSRLEMLYRCSYQHFVQYNLRLEERRTYKLDAPDIGQLFHEAIKTITEWVKQEGRDFSKMTEKDATQYAAKSVHHLAPALQHHILSSSNRYQYIQRKLEETIAKATFILSEQARQSGFSPVGIELGFGFEEGLDPLKITLPNGYELLLRGRIDRVDQSVGQEELYLRIIDYKSSDRGLDLADVYYGLALQMLTYLNVVLTQAKTWLGMEAHPAGVLYFHVHDAMLQEAEKISDDAIVDKIFKQYKMSGLVAADETIARLMDTSLDTGRSDIVPVGFKKDGSFYSDSNLADETTFGGLKRHIDRLIRQAGLQLTSGEIELNPYEDAKGNACRFCSFKSVCQFDPILAENNFRRLAKLKEKEALEKILEANESEGGEILW